MKVFKDFSRLGIMPTEKQNVFIGEPGKVIIYADNRETSEQLNNILRKRCELRMAQLEVADYLLSERVAVERKKSSDFLQSMIDGRLFKQLSNMKENFEISIMIIEGEELFDENRKIHPNAIRGALASIAVDYNIPIIWTKSALEIAEQLFMIAKREQLDEKRSIAIRGKRRVLSPNQEQEFLIAGLPGISTVNTKRLLKHFGSPEKVFAAPESELMKVEGIGEIMAKRIRTILRKKYEKSILED
jgi:Fanconi anemia group M protein